MQGRRYQFLPGSFFHGVDRGPLYKRHPKTSNPLTSPNVPHQSRRLLNQASPKPATIPLDNSMGPCYKEPQLLVTIKRHLQGAGMVQSVDSSEEALEPRKHRLALKPHGMQRKRPSYVPSLSRLEHHGLCGFDEIQGPQLCMYV